MRRIERKGLLLTAAFSAVLAGFGRSLKRFLGHLVRLNHSFIKQVETFSQRCPHPTAGFLSAVGLRHRSFFLSGLPPTIRSNGQRMFKISAVIPFPPPPKKKAAFC